MPLLVASRALEMSASYLSDIHGINDYIPDSEVSVFDNGEHEFDKLKVCQGTPFEFTITGDTLWGMMLVVVHEGRRHVLNTEDGIDGPRVVSSVDFSRYGRGKTYEQTLSTRTDFAPHNLDMCMRIANVCAKRMVDFSFLLRNGYWRDSSSASAWYIE